MEFIKSFAKLVTSMLILTLSIGPGLLAKKRQRTGPIPGIDKLPAAYETKKRALPISKESYKDGKVPDTKKEETQKDEQTPPHKKQQKKEEIKKKAEGKFPIIRNIKVNLNQKNKNTVFITWEVNAKNKTKIFVGRYKTPLRTRSLVLAADNLTSPALGPQEKRFTDRNIPQGTYYYVVVTQEEMLTGNKLKLIPGQNFSNKPIKIKPYEHYESVKPITKLPRIKKISVHKHPEKKDSAIISWKYYGSETDVFIVRDSRPIVSRAIALSAIPITRQPLRSTSLLYIDRNIPRGKYYYAIYTTNEIQKELILKANDNYSTISFQSPGPGPRKIKKLAKNKNLPEKKVEKINGKSYRISRLNAVNSTATVKLNWKPAIADKIYYTIYRGPFPLEGKEGFKRAEILGNVPETQFRFEDKTPVLNKRVFYGVTVSDKTTGKEYRNLIAGKSYRAHSFIKRRLKRKISEFLPDALTPLLENNNSIALHWTKPNRSIRGYRVYRLNRPIYGKNPLNEAKMVGRVSSEKSTYQDKNLKPGQYYYALFPINKKGEEIEVFKEGRTFTGFGITIFKRKKQMVQKDKKSEIKKKVIPKKRKPEINNFKAVVQRKDVLLSWEKDVKKRKDITFRLYRSELPLRNMKELLRNGIIINELPGKTGHYRDRELSDGIYHYAILPEANGKLFAKMMEGRNFLKRPVTIRTGNKIKKTNAHLPDKKKEKYYVKRPNEFVKENAIPRRKKYNYHIKNKSKNARPFEVQKVPTSYKRLNNIIRKTYKRGRYTEAVRKLSPYISDLSLPRAMRAKALFFTGLSYYKIRRYGSAVEYFLNSHVRENYPDRSRFWYRRSLEKIK